MIERVPCRVCLVGCLVILAALAVAGPAFADPPAIKGMVGFDWSRTKQSKCSKVEGALLATLTKSYTCAAPDKSISSASGKPVAATCKAKRGKSEYLLFASAADCNEERDTQLANAG